MPNDTGKEPGAVVPLMTFNDAAGRWELGGFGKVSGDGTVIESLDGMGVRHFSLVAAAPPTPKIEVINEGVHTVGADSIKGAAETAVPLPEFQVLGRKYGPELTYSSLAAAPSVLFTI